MSEFKISVIIPTYNCVDELRRTLRGLEKQHIDTPPFEVIVSDDGSTDETPRFLSQYSGSLNLISLRFPENRGRSAARNAAIKVASSELLLLLDSDMDSPPDLINRHLSEHGKPNLAIVGGVKFPRQGKVNGYSRYWESRGAQRNPIGGEIKPRYFLSGHSSIPLDLARNIGGFDEDIDYYGEDIDFGIRLGKAGAKMHFVPDIITLHLHQRTLASMLGVFREYGRRTIPRLLQKHPELRDELGISWGERKGMIGWLRRALLSAPMYYPLLVIGILLDWLGVATRLYTYLSFRSYFVGYRRNRLSSQVI